MIFVHFPMIFIWPRTEMPLSENLRVLGCAGQGAPAPLGTRTRTGTCTRAHAHAHAHRPTKNLSNPCLDVLERTRVASSELVKQAVDSQCHLVSTQCSRCLRNGVCRWRHPSLEVRSTPAAPFGQTPRQRLPRKVRAPVLTSLKRAFKRSWGFPGTFWNPKEGAPRVRRKAPDAWHRKKQK